MKKFIQTTTLLASCVLAISISSCTKDNDNNVVKAKVQLVNASPDAGASNLYVNGALTNNTTVAYGTASGYSDILIGSGQSVEVKSTTGSTLANTTSDFDAGINYSVFLTGQSSASNLSAIVAKDDQTAPASGNVRIRFVNAASISPAVDISSSGSVFFSAQSYKAVTSYIEKPAGAYVFKLNIAGSSTALVTTPSITLQSGKIYTIFAKSLLVSGSLVLDAAVIANN